MFKLKAIPSRTSRDPLRNMLWSIHARVSGFQIPSLRSVLLPGNGEGEREAVVRHTFSFIFNNALLSSILAFYHIRYTSSSLSLLRTAIDFCEGVIILSEVAWLAPAVLSSNPSLAEEASTSGPFKTFKWMHTAAHQLKKAIIAMQ